MLFYYSVEWLQTFAYHTTLTPYVFIVAGLLNVTLAVITLLYHGIKASTNNQFAEDSYEPIIWYRYQKRAVIENSEELFSCNVINNKLFANCTPNTSALLISLYDINGKLLYNCNYQIGGKQTFELDLKSILNVTHQFSVISVNVINSDGKVDNYYEKIIW